MDGCQGGKNEKEYKSVKFVVEGLSCRNCF